MTVSATTTRNDYIAAAGQTVFAYTFKALDSTDLVVTKNGVVQSAYSVSGIGVATGGNVTFTSGVTANDAIAIYLAMPVTRDTNYQEGGAFLAGEVNSDFDKIYIGAIQNENAIDRSMRLPESEPSVSMTLPSKADRLGTVLGFNAVTGAPEAGPTIVAAGTIASIAADIETVAGISSNVVVVSGLQGNINNLGPISQDIIVVSEISSDVTALNTDPLKSDINTVAGISSDVTGVSGISAAVTAVNNSASTIASVNANLPKISIVAASDAEVTTVADNIADVVNVNADLTGDDTIGTVAGAIANVNTVGGNITNVNTVAGDTSAINAVNANAANINAVSANGTNISTVAGDTTAINSVAGAIPAITAVNTDPLKTNIANVNANSSNITAVANNAANINNVANNSASINTVAADGADIGTVAGISADVSSVANIAPNVTTVSGMETKIDTVIADAADIGTVAVNIGSVTTVAAISGDVTTVSGISTDVTSVADNMTAVQNAVTSATNAAASASSASTSASSAATSESNAAISAGNAATSASNAATSASNASASSASASNSANVASNASTSAASSAASAGSSDTNAAASAANAAASAVNASNSEIAAASSATDSSVAASTWNSYYSTYLGAAASAPSTDLLGQSLQNGALYFNTTDDTMYVFNGTTWIAAESTINNVDWGGQLAGNLNTNGYSINFGDNDKAQFGAGNDLQIYHDGGNSLIEEAGVGNLIIRGSGNVDIQPSGGGAYMARFAASGASSLYYNGSAKLATTATGIDVTGTATMDGLTVDSGSGAEIIISRDDTSLADGDFIGGIKFGTNDSSTAYGTPPHYSAGIKAKARGTVGLMDMHLYAGQTNDAYEEDTPSMTLSSNGDISFYEDTGITAKLVWDASAESLNLSSSNAYVVTNSGRAINGLDIAGAEGSLGSYGGAISFGTGRTGRSAIAAVQGHATDGDANGLAFFTHESSGSTSDSAKRMQINNNGDISFYENTGTTAKLFWDASAESLGIGTSSPAFPLDISGDRARIAGGTTTTFAGLEVENSNGFGTIFGTGGSERTDLLDNRGFISAQSATSGLALGTEGADPVVFYTGGTTLERMRIDSAGNLLVGTTQSRPAEFTHPKGISLRGDIGQIQLSTDGNPAMFLNRDTNDGQLIEFRREGLAVGSIGAGGGDVVVASRNNKGFKIYAPNADGTGTILHPSTDASGNPLDAKMDLGYSSGRFKDLYLSGTAIANSGFQVGTTGIGNIGNSANDVVIYSSAAGHNGLRFHANGILPTNNAGAIIDADADIGISSHRFKDLHLSGGVYLGGTGAANKLDDYETGTFTPVMENVTGWSGSSGVDGNYTKIGNTVHVFISMTSNVALTGTPTHKLTGLPFSSDLTERTSNVSVSRMFGIGLTTTDYIAGVAGTEIVFSYVNGDNNVNNLTHSGSTLRFTLSATYTTAA